MHSSTINAHLIGLIHLGCLSLPNFGPVAVDGVEDSEASYTHGPCTATWGWQGVQSVFRSDRHYIGSVLGIARGSASQKKFQIVKHLL